MSVQTFVNFVVLAVIFDVKTISALQKLSSVCKSLDCSLLFGSSLHNIQSLLLCNLVGTYPLGNTEIFIVIFDIYSEASVCQSDVFALFGGENFAHKCGLLVFFLHYLQAFFETDFQRVGCFRQSVVLAVVTDVCTKATAVCHNFLTIVSCHNPRKFEQIQSLFHCYGTYGLRRFERGKLRLDFVRCFANLNHCTEASNLCIDVSAALRVSSEQTFAAFAFAFFGCLHLFVERSVKLSHHFLPTLFSLSYEVELFFYLCGKVVVNYVCKMLNKEVVYHRAYVGRVQLAFLAAIVLFLATFAHLAVLKHQDHNLSLLCGIVLLGYIFAFLYCGDCRSVCRRTTYA